MVAVPLIMADLSRHVLQDVDIWHRPSSNQYLSDCGSESFECLTVVGWLFTVVFTYSGFALLVCGSMWHANICMKCTQIRQKWRKLRRQRKRAQKKAMTSVVGNGDLSEKMLAGAESETGDVLL